jgi:hypothetical protein
MTPFPAGDPPQYQAPRRRVFDRRVSFDERSRGFPIRALLPREPRSYTWKVGPSLDQGNEGACVGFAWAHELAARPSVIDHVSAEVARTRLYHEARRLDAWPGEDYEGTSIIAGAKAVKALGGILEYRWAFGLDDLRLAVGHAGPAVLGINWHEAMEETDEHGYIHAAGMVLGGHAIVCYGVNQKGKYFLLQNSWGPSWGNEGSCRISFDDMNQLLRDDGEACIPVGRKRISL